ncbi:30S ribosomal protein S1 [Marinitoga sp. 1135]|uniref:Ribosomal protein S1 n=1 Tax=Marinitoga piezophila (strain DSM 14283 / JCM 11233 / KA3) TaxID=443254 RepID=H2J642_MARPK|nr:MULTISPECIES: S1 RNA-binding domain-containing protein [Marinitoga]AEX85103.1 ribosomal protein S1 [Marinitoga piezophila KA3]APT75607.1 30S ribosomal protein S1 [Marinitoga sp. 1137]NUU95316.1 30S ribosomal protein S1 [Marinitoga sp. 1135]NUU97250.1 30S ribosomal protein S1 [Marinitoga sp. 1138]
MVEDKNEFEKMLDEVSEFHIKKGETLTGEIISISSDGVYVSAPGKAFDVYVGKDYLLKNIDEYKKGEKIKVKLLKINDAEGQAFGSEKAAKKDEIIDEIVEGKVVKGKIKERVEKGYIVELENVVRAFLPGSLAMLNPNEPFPREEMDFLVIKREERRRRLNIVVSRKGLVDKYIEEFFNTHNLNTLVEGVVTGIKEFGLFISLNPYITALVPKSEISWDKKVDINEMYKIGDKVKGIIIKLDKENRKISVSVKRLKDDPWETVEKDYPVDSIVEGEVIEIFPFGFAVKLGEGIEGLVHESEIFWSGKRKIEDVVSVGDKVKVKVLSIDKDKKKITLSYKQVLGDPWKDIDEKLHEGDIVDGVVEKILPNGLIIKLDNELTGFSHVSELSWNFVDNVEDLFKEGDKVKVKVLHVDKENRKIKLSVKQAKENPWKKVSNELKNGDEISGKVVKYVGKGAVIIVDEYEVEAFIPKSKINLEENQDIKDVLEIGSTVNGKIIKIEFEAEDQKGSMVVSLLEE